MNGKIVVLAAFLLFAIVGSGWAAYTSFFPQNNSLLTTIFPCIVNGTNGAIINGTLQYFYTTCQPTSSANNVSLYYNSSTVYVMLNDTTQLPNTLRTATGSNYLSTSTFSGAVAAIMMNETSGTTAYDALGAYNFTGNATVNQSSAVFGNAYGFLYDQLTNPSDMGFGEAFSSTRIIWIRPTSTTTAQGIWEATTNPNGVCYGLSVGATGLYAIRTVANVGEVDTAQVAAPSGSWMQIAVAYEGVSGNLSLFINGTLKASVHAAGAFPTGCTPGQVIGTSPDFDPGKWFKGNVSDYLVFNSRLPDAEINQIYQNGINTPGYGNLKLTQNVISVLPITTQPSFVNASAGHSFTVLAGVNDSSGFGNVTSTNISSTNCVYLSNTTSGTIFNVTYNCTSAFPVVENISIGFFDLFGGYNQTNTASNSYPSHPVLTAPNSSNLAPNITSLINCTNGTFSNTDGDSENTSNRTWVWYYKGSILANASTQQISLQNFNVSKNNNLSCNETTSANNWPAFQVTNSSANFTIVNSNPVANSPTSFQTSQTFIQVNCSANDADGGTDISKTTLSSSSGSIAAISNGTSGTLFWQGWNVTGLAASTLINVTCNFTDSSNANASVNGSFTSSIVGDYYLTETQIGMALANTSIPWLQVYYTANVTHNCFYTPQKTDFINSTAPFVVNNLSNLVSSTSNLTSFNWSCNSTFSPYNLTFFTAPIVDNTQQIFGSPLGNNALQYQLQVNQTLPINLNFTFTYSEASQNRKLWQCVLNNFTTCNAGNIALWAQVTYTEFDTGNGFNDSRSVALNSLQGVFVTTNDGLPPPPSGGGGGGGTYVPPYTNATTTVVQVGPVVTPIAPVPLLSNIITLFKPTCNSGYSFGIPNYWIFSVFYFGYLVITVSVAVKTRGQTLLREIDILIFLVWFGGLVYFLPIGAGTC